MNEKISFIYPQYEFNDTAAALLFKKNGDYYYDKEMTKKINKSDMFDLFVNGNILVVDSNGKYTKIASCTEDGTIKEAGTCGSGAVDPADIAKAVNNYFEEHPSTIEPMTKAEMLAVLRGGDNA